MRVPQIKLTHYVTLARLFLKDVANVFWTSTHVKTNELVRLKSKYTVIEIPCNQDGDPRKISSTSSAV